MGFSAVRVFNGVGLWLVPAMALSAASGVLYAQGQVWWAVGVMLLALASAIRVMHAFRRMRRRLHYLFSAAVSGDFSYKFPMENVGEGEKEVNRILNRIVEHLESLTENARQNEEFLSVIINLVDIGILVANDKGHVVHSNKAALSLLSLPVINDVRQMPAGVPGLSVAQTPATLQGCRLTIYTITDIRKPLQAAEVESWEKLTRVLTHEIMNSLTPIRSIAESLSGEADAELAQQLAVISSSSGALMEFVKNFRKFSLLPPSNPRVFYLKPFVSKVVSLAKASEAAEGIEFNLMVFPPDAMVCTDESLLNQVLVNILKNAVEAAPANIDVTAKVRDDECVEISVTNDGELIPDNLADQVFTPFFTTKPSGSGIGLSLSRRIIAQLGGTLSLSTRPVTRFTIILN